MTARPKERALSDASKRGQQMSSTRGPWMAAGAPSSVVGWPVVGPLGRSICNVSWMPKKAYPDVSDADYAAFNAECEANARLIAAAPELLAALRELADTSRAYLARMDADDIAALETARAAIAKAEGGV